MASQETRQVGSACRIYKNAANKIIAIDKISVTANILRLNLETFRCSVDKITTCRTLLHLDGAGSSRVVASIQMIGSYSSIEDNGGNFLVATWEMGDQPASDVVVSFQGKVALLGETV